MLEGVLKGVRMKRLLSFALIAVVTAAALVFAAPTRGGTLTYGRYADSLFLDPVFTDAKLDIWILQKI